MDTLIAPFPKRIARIGQQKAHRAGTLTQAIDVQAAMHYATVQTTIDYRHASTPAERKDLLPHLAKATDAWRIATDARHNAQGRPRAGSLSPAERAAMRQRKASRSKSSGPKLSAKESLSRTEPSPRVAPAGGESGGERGQGTSVLPEAPKPADGPKLASG